LKEADKRNYFLTTDNIVEQVICGYIHDYLEERPEWVFDVVVKGAEKRGYHLAFTEPLKEVFEAMLQEQDELKKRIPDLEITVKILMDELLRRR